jgi:adenosylmethionine-8-amino-7-oxononanoate aminotransferase
MASCSFAPALKLHAKIKAQAMAHGLLCYPMGGTIDGLHGDHVLLAPPFISSEAQLDQVVERLGDAIDKVLATQAIAA